MKLKELVENEANLAKLVDSIISQNELFSDKLENVCKANGIQLSESTNLKDQHHEKSETENAPTPLLLATLPTPEKKKTKATLAMKGPGNFPNEFDIQSFKKGKFLSSDTMNMMIDVIRERNKRKNCVIVSGFDTQKILGIQSGTGFDFSCNSYEKGLGLGELWRKQLSYLCDDYEKVEKKDCNIPYLVGEECVTSFIFQANIPNSHWFTIEANVVQKTVTLYDSFPKYKGARVISEEPRIKNVLCSIDWMNNNGMLNLDEYASFKKLFEETNSLKCKDSDIITKGSLLPTMALQEILQLFRKENDNRGSNVKGMDMEGWTLKVSSQLPTQYATGNNCGIYASLVTDILSVGGDLSIIASKQETVERDARITMLSLITEYCNRKQGI